MEADGGAYPVLADGIIFVPVSDGCAALGGPRDEYFSGLTAKTLLPRLPPLLGGTLTVAEIASALAIETATAWQIVQFLADRDLIRVAGEPLAGTMDMSPMWMFLQRTTPRGRGAAIVQRLREASIWVTGTGPLPGRIRALLTQSGVGRVEQPGEAPGAVRDSGAAPDLVIAVSEEDRDGPPGAGTHIPPAPSSPQGPWLRVHAYRDRVSVGPLFNLPGAACQCCFSDQAAAGAGTAGPITAAGQLAAWSRTGLAAGIAAGAALRCVGGHGTPSLRREVMEVFSGCADPREWRVTPRPDCPGCGRPGIALSVGALTEFEYELGVDPARAGGDLRPFAKDQDSPEGPSRRFIIEPRMTVRDLRVTGAPASGALPATAGTVTAGTGEALGTVCAMLQHSVGACPPPAGPRSGPQLPSWAPTVGNLRTTHAYVFCDAATGPGGYYFDELSDELVVLSHHPPLPAGLVPPGGAAIVLVGDLVAARRRLGPAARRVAYQDAGMAAAHLYLCGRTLGWSVRVRSGETAELLKALDLDPTREAVALALEVQPACATRASALPPAGALASASPAGSSRGGRTTGDRKLSRLLRRYPVTYQFGATPPAAATIATVIHGSVTATTDLWDSEPRAESVLYARHVCALPRGMYTLSGGPELTESQTGVFESGPLETYLADRNLDPPALLLLTGDLPGTLAAAGAGGYRAMVAQSAAAAGLARLGAATNGLVAGLFARLPPTLVSASLRDQRDLHRVFYGCAMGHRPVRSRPATGGVEW